MAKSAVLQATATISKTTQVVMGAAIETGHYDYLALFFVYTKGNETGLNIYPYFLSASGGTEYQLSDWATVTGTYTRTAEKLQFTATTSGYIVLDVRGIEFVKFYQGGSNNDGTPTGTIAASYTLK